MGANHNQITKMVLKTIANKSKMTEEQMVVWKILLEECHIVESLLHCAIVVGEMLSCKVDGFPIKFANVLFSTGHKYTKPHKIVLRKLFAHLTNENLKIQYKLIKPTRGQPQWPFHINWSAFDDLEHTNLVNYD